MDRDKIASVGIAVRGGIAFHGLALNYGPDLSFFDLINPCGLKGVRMTSMSRILKRNVSQKRLRDTISINLEHQFDLESKAWSLEYLMKRVHEEKSATQGGKAGHGLDPH